MRRFFNLDNPVWRFVGNIADMFLLSAFWYLCCLPVFTAGAGTTALFYVTLKLTSNQEGYTCSSYWRSFHANFRQATTSWLLFFLIGAVIGIDLYWCLFGGVTRAIILLPVFVIAAVLYLLNLSFLFPLLARCENTTKTLLKMNFVISLRCFLPVLSTIMVTSAVFSIGIFAFWPLLLIAPGLSAYLNSYIFNRILQKYHLDLPR